MIIRITFLFEVENAISCFLSSDLYLTSVQSSFLSIFFGAVCLRLMFWTWMLVSAATKLFLEAFLGKTKEGNEIFANFTLLTNTWLDKNNSTAKYRFDAPPENCFEILEFTKWVSMALKTPGIYCLLPEFSDSP